MENEEKNLLNLIILHLKNNSLRSSLDNNTSSYVQLLSVNERDKEGYDGQGALMYVVVVLCIYGLSIILMIGSVIKKSKHDNGVSKYMKDMNKLRQYEKRQMKYKARMVFHNNKQLAQLLERRSSERSFQGSIDIIQEESESEFASVDALSISEEGVGGLVPGSPLTSSLDPTPEPQYACVGSDVTFNHPMGTTHSVSDYKPMYGSEADDLNTVNRQDNPVTTSDLTLDKSVRSTQSIGGTSTSTAIPTSTSTALPTCTSNVTLTTCTNIPAPTSTSISIPACTSVTVPTCTNIPAPTCTSPVIKEFSKVVFV